MKIESLQLKKTNRWTKAWPTEMDSKQTLIFLFAGSEFLSESEPFDTLSQSFPESHLFGCSTEEAIDDSVARDRDVPITIVRANHQTGFYSYGELSPHSRSFCDLHNQSMIVTTIFED